ncbi:MAG: hypothetical protein OEU91_07425 [Gammaproteobacteria bacterium]|nr:hypothetical protein [Gammaproteobacteria bacterium]
MRLLELRRNAGDAESPASVVLQEPTETPDRKPRRLKQPVAGQATPGAARVFPINPLPQPDPARRRPINLEQLQQRIEVLEQRIQKRLLKQDDVTKKADLEQLLKRMKRLERRIDTELWTARQREHTLLEMLAKPPLNTVIQQRARQLCTRAPHTVWCWFKAFGKEWWLDCQPLWWPKFAAAWQEALTQARR